MDSNVKIAGLSSKIQQNMNSVLQNMPVISRPANFFDSLQTRPEMVSKRIKSGRNPSTGMIHRVHSMSPMRPSTAATGPSYGIRPDTSKTVTETSKLNTRVIEGWLNSTLADAEYLDIPGCIIKNDKKLPLIRYGIDRANLMSSGLSISDIDSIYHSLFVHSIGYFQTLTKILEHSERRYTIITGLWKVYAVLLEYCCKLDYKMIITTLNIEKKDELEQLELSYKNQLVYFEENQRELEKNLTEFKEQIRRLQRQLDLETQRKEELEDELMQKGSGHEEEVSIRIQFESKVNQMYAKQRDMELRAANMQENIEDLKKTVEIKTGMYLKEKKSCEDVMASREKCENELRRTDEKLKQTEVERCALDQRLNEAYAKIEELTKDYSTAAAEISNATNVITQKRIENEDKKYEVEVKLATIAKLEKNIEELKAEKNIYLKRTIELETMYNDECDKNHHYKQEYARIKESDNFYAVEYMKFKEKAEEYEKRWEDCKEEKNRLRIQLESLIQGYEEYKIQVKKSQERIEEMNKGRRAVEETNEYLNSRLSEKNEELKDSRNLNLELKDDIEKLKTHESSLESEITTLTIKLKSLEKQYDANKETMQQKINSLSDIISSEKRLRESWIFKFEEEQKNHSTSSRLLVAAQDQQNELIMKLNSAQLSIEDKKQKIAIQTTKNSEQLEEILELKATQEESTRKYKTLQMLYENSEKERVLMIQTHAQEIETLNQLKRENSELLMSGIEEMRIYASINLQLFNYKTRDFNDLQSSHNALQQLQASTYNQLQKTIENFHTKSMYIEEIEQFLIKKLEELQNLHTAHTELRENYNVLYEKHEKFVSMIPEDLKFEENPFKILVSKVESLSTIIQEIEYFKSQMIDFEAQHDIIVVSFDMNTQTDIGFSFFEKTRRVSSSGTPHSGSQRVYSAKSREAPATIAEYPYRKKEFIPPQHSESALREETPLNMSSVYNQSFQHLRNLPALKKSQNALNNRQPAPPDIKRLIKTANSRRKHDTNFL